MRDPIEGLFETSAMVVSSTFMNIASETATVAKASFLAV